MKLRKKKPIVTPTAFDLWDQEFEPPLPQAHIARPGGNPRAQILVLLPVPTEWDYENETVFSSDAANIFRHLLQETIGLRLQDCLLVPCVRYGEKALKGNTANVMLWVQQCVEQKLFRMVICVGSDAAKWIINGGKKANIASLAGQTLYPKQLNHIPLFLFPDVKGLVPEPHPDRREMYFRTQAAEGHLRRLRLLTTNLGGTLRTLFPQNV